MKTLALDLSSKSTGYAIYENQQLEKYGCISASSANLYKRIEKMITELTTILKENKIEKVVIEDVIPEDVHNNNTVFKALIYLQGFIVHKLDQYKLVPTFFTASE